MTSQRLKRGLGPLVGLFLIVALPSGLCAANPLIRAASLEKEAEALRLLRHGKIDVNARDGSGETALMAAVGSQLPLLVKALLEAGARTDLKYGELQENVVFEAVRGGDEGITDQLLDRHPGLLHEKNNQGGTVYLEAVKSGHYNLVLHLLGRYPKAQSLDPKDRQTLLEHLERSKTAAALKLKKRLLAIPN